ncbi:DUF7341 domain-containing protein [Nesterenkonia sphaerica]|uniref:DUF7341 domain-containing protein n=1 Tax=Nesterenkonia sphaerica TaxID=1804988 RepID=A0A5R8ZXM2_9MICC|nr:hypothetical protein [Nesterenkonia sphaerica]TLP70684.1 hypothetical protein FEF27_12840 [Nesterenkonia sphaerica]
MPNIKLRETVHDLTRRHIRRDGLLHGQWEDALLDQLQEAVTVIGSGSGGATTETAAPANLLAVDTQNAIAEDVRDTARARGEDWQQPVKAILQHWGDHATDDDMRLTDLALDIADRIRGAIERQVKPIPLDHACPVDSCAKRHIRQQDEAGDWVKRPALLVTCRDDNGTGLGFRDWVVHCAACGAWWQGCEAIAWLGRTLIGNRDRMTTV